MRVDRSWLWQDVAPADNFASRNCHELRITLFDDIKNKVARLFDRRSLQKCQVSPFPRDYVESAMKAFDKARLDRNNVNHIVPSGR